MDLKFTLGGERHRILHGGDYKSGGPEIKQVYNPENKTWYTVKRPRIEHKFQVSSYVGADIEESGEKYGSSWMLYFGKDTGEFHAFEVKSQKSDYKCFLGLLETKKRLLEQDNKKELLSQV